MISVCHQIHPPDNLARQIYGKQAWGGYNDLFQVIPLGNVRIVLQTRLWDLGGLSPFLNEPVVSKELFLK